MSNKVGDPCPYCLRTLTKKVFKEKYMRKVANARLSVKKAIANGNHRSGGRPKLRDDNLIRLLRKKGLSIRAIAREIGLSTSAVQRGLKNEQVNRRRVEKD